MSNGVANVIAYGNESISFIFGGLVSDKMFEVFGAAGLFLLCAFCRSSFFSSLIAVLYYLGIMQFVIRILGALRAVRKLRARNRFRTANIFVGQTEHRWWYVLIATMTALNFCGDVVVWPLLGSVLAYAQMGVRRI